MESPWLTPQEAATYLRITVPSLYGQCRRGNVRYRRIGRLMRFRKEWLDEPSTGSRKERKGPGT